jgi:DNA (cytosine-5)-methyltransferase 1
MSRPLLIGSLCSGYEGLGMGVARVLGGELAWVADNDPGACAILGHRFPGVPNLGDITVADWAAVEPVDVLTAGFPCTDVSMAGARAGLRNGTRSGIWANVAQAVGALRPRLVVIENVRGLLTARGDEPTLEHLRAEAARDLTVQLLQWLDAAENVATTKGDVRRVKQCRARTACVVGLRKRAVARCLWHERRLVRAIGTVLGDLARLGFDAQWCCVRASDVGAPHRRERVFILAWPATDAEREPVRMRPGNMGVAQGTDQSPGDQRERVRLDDRDGGPGFAEDADRPAGDQRRLAGPGETAGRRPRADTRGPSGTRTPADAERGRRDRGAFEPQRGPVSGTAPAGDSEVADSTTAADPESDGRDERRTEPARIIRGPDAPLSGDRPPADADRSGREGDAEPYLESRGGLESSQWDDPDGRVLDWRQYGPAIRRWEHTIGRQAPRPTEPGRTGQRLSPAFVEWMQGLPPGWVTDVPGLSRNQMLKALGNGVVPQQAAHALRVLLTQAKGACDAAA